MCLLHQMTLLGESTHLFFTHTSVFDEKIVGSGTPVSPLGWIFTASHLELVSDSAPENLFASSDDLAWRIHALVLYWHSRL